jgi:V/A-type H+-transporting ATPase subunit D
MRRLRTAHLAADLLDRKLRILLAEQERLRARAGAAAAAWRLAWRSADTWALRGTVLAGHRELSLAAAPVPARCTVEWVNVMGIRYPAAARCLVPEPPGGSRSPGSAALVKATAAYRDALAAAAAHAAADATGRILAAEIAATRRRLHAITDRWVPRLEDALRERVTRLAEDELAETVRLRWAAGRVGTPG